VTPCAVPTLASIRAGFTLTELLVVIAAGLTDRVTTKLHGTRLETLEELEPVATWPARRAGGVV
jgi:prepilin-type N-terminal cleavage/methylation domain-containing protein